MKKVYWNIKQYDDKIVKESKVENGYETSNVWQIEPTYNRIHSAVFPDSLCERIIKYYSFKNDLVFDPFAGSGTFGRAAKSLDRYFFLTEKEQKYFTYMPSFIEKNDTNSTNLFETSSSRFLTFETFKEQII